MNFNIVRDDITRITVDAMVLPANSKLKPGDGVSATIFAKAGRDYVKKDLKRYGHVEVGNSVPTRAFALPAKYIIHSDVPAWKDGKHDEYLLLCASYISALALADRMGCKSIAFPLLASGNNGFDPNIAFEVATKCLAEYEPAGKLGHAELVLYGMRPTELAKNAGYDVEERIEQEYVIAHSEDQKDKGKVVAAAEWGKGIAEAFADDAITMLDEYLNDPETRKELIKEAGSILISVIKEAV